MVGFDDRPRTLAEPIRLFYRTYPDRPPISQTIVSRVEAKFKEFGDL